MSVNRLAGGRWRLDAATCDTPFVFMTPPAHWAHAADTRWAGARGKTARAASADLQLGVLQRARAAVSEELEQQRHREERRREQREEDLGVADGGAQATWRL